MRLYFFPIIFCPWCILQVILYAIVCLFLLFLGKVCKIKWAERAYNWCVIKMKAIIEAAKIWKKKPEDPICPCDKCSCDKIKEDVE